MKFELVPNVKSHSDKKPDWSNKTCWDGLDFISEKFGLEHAVFIVDSNIDGV